MASSSSGKKSKSWMRSGTDKKTRSARFRYYLAFVCLIGAVINYAYVMYKGTVQMVDYVLLGAGIVVFALIATLYELEKQGKIFKKD